MSDHQIQFSETAFYPKQKFYKHAGETFLKHYCNFAVINIL